MIFNTDRTIPDLLSLNIPKTENFNPVRYISNQVLHQTIQLGHYSYKLKRYLLQTQQLDLQLNERKEQKITKLREQQLSEREIRLATNRTEQQLTEHIFRKFIKKNPNYQLSNKYYRSQIIDAEQAKISMGWEGQEEILESLIAQLLNYTEIRVQRQLALREKDRTAKIASRRVDLVLFQKYIQRYIRDDRTNAGSLVCIELKPNYIDANDVTDCWYTKQYLQKTIEAFPNVRAATMLFLSPLGITETAASKLTIINDEIERKRFKKNELSNKIRIQTYSATISQFIQAIYCCAKYSYRDDKGAIGKQWSYIKPEIDKIVWKIENPTFWLEDYLNIDNKVKLEMKFENS